MQMFNFPQKPEKPRIQLGQVMIYMRTRQWYFDILKAAGNISTLEKATILNREFSDMYFHQALIGCDIAPSELGVRYSQQVAQIADCEHPYPLYREMIDPNGNKALFLMKNEDGDAILLAGREIIKCPFNSLTPTTQSK